MMVVIIIRLSYWNKAFERYGFSKLQFYILFFGYLQNDELIKVFVRNKAKARCTELQQNKHVMVCALIDSIDRMDDFESRTCKNMYHMLHYNADDLISKTEQELSEMLVIAEEIAGMHCGYPNSIESHCAASRVIALRKNSLSFKCDDNGRNGCDDCEYCSMISPCPDAYDTWIARDLSKEKCKDGSLRYGFLKEMLQLCIKPDVDYKFLYPEGTFDEALERKDYQNSLERYYNEIADEDDDEITGEDEDDFDLGV